MPVITEKGSDVIAVTATGAPGSYSFIVTIESPDTGCERYADWWEVLTPEGKLLYRRVLLHSHVGEQPFTRSGGPVNVDADEEVLVRAHMNDTGYGGTVQRGTVAEGFEPWNPDVPTLPDLSDRPPLPNGCGF